MKQYQKLSTTLLLLTATAFAGVAVASVPALAAPGGIPGPNPNAPGQKANGPTINTTDGPVQGFVQNGVNQFLGIPYAAPPVGDLRWKPPQPPAHHAKIDATEFANTCPQVTTLGPFAGPASTTEDCLYLNVFTTGATGALKPVIVWIYGGGNITGESNDYDGSKLATGGPNGVPTVVVTMNYRVGLFGVISHPALNTGSAWGNYGILDILAVLHWVHDNAANFGGDPNNVTLGGQSAGALNTAVLQISPLAAGLFHRAINQSGPIGGAIPTAASVLTKGNNFAAKAGCSDAACLRGLSAARVLQLQGTPNVGGPYTSQPFVDGNIIPVQPADAWASGNYSHMPIMGGSVKDEATFGFAITEYFANPQVALTPAQYMANNSAAVLAEYPLSAYNNNPTQAQDRVSTDRGKCQSLNTLKAQAATNTGFGVYGWDFAYQQPPSYFPQMPNAYDSTGHFQAHAYHTSDIQFLFVGYHGGNLGVNLDPISGLPRELQGAEIGLSDQMVAAWTNFAKTGNPNGSGAPVWPVLTTNSASVLQQDTPNSTETEAQYRANYKCAFWGL